MANIKISALPSTTAATDNDIIAIVDSGFTTTSKITKADFLSGVGGDILWYSANTGSVRYYTTPSSAITGNYNFMFGMPSSSIVGGTSEKNVILGSDGSTITNASGGVMIGGVSNVITDADNSLVIGGYLNQITASLNNNAIVGGQGGTIQTDAEQSGLFVGNSNDIFASDNSTIIAGTDNTIQGGGNRQGILVGFENTINSNGNQLVILGGKSNTIGPNTVYQSAIIAGEANQISGGNEKSVIIGGFNNNIKSYGDISTIIGSQLCSALGYKTTIIGAENSNINNDSRFSFMLGGYGNAMEGSNTQGVGIINSWQSKTWGSGAERFMIANSDNCEITGSSYTNKHATIIASTNSEIAPNRERAVLIGLSGKSALYSATTQVENLHAHKVISNDVINVGGVSGTIDVDLSQGTLYKFVLQGNSTVNFSNWREGAQYKFFVYNDGSYTITAMTISGGGSVYTKSGNLPNPTNNGRTLYSATIMEGDIILTEDLDYQAV